MVISKPVMRGFTVAKFKRDMIGATILATVAGLSYRYLVAIPRREKYAEFYKTYDIEAEYERIKNLGYFQSTAIIEGAE